MELNKIKASEIVGYDIAKLKEMTIDIRKEMAMMSVNIFDPANKKPSKIKGLRRSLARTLTVMSAKSKADKK